MTQDRSTEEVENDMFANLMSDPYFSQSSEFGMLEPGHVQTISRLEKTRNLAALFGTAEQVEEQFAQHAEAIRLLDAVANACKSSAAELQASIKALKKAKALEEKEIAKEKECQAKAAERAEKAEAKKLHKRNAALEKKAQEAEAAGECADGKKRRAATNLAAELVDGDPLVLKSKFPNRQMAVVESVVPCQEWGRSCSLVQYLVDSQ